MRKERNACRGEAWRARSTRKRKILTRLDMTKNGSEPRRSRTRNSYLKALQTIPEGIDAFSEWTLAWAQGRKEKMNEDGTSKEKLRQVALQETPMKLIELIAVDEATDNLVTLMQTQHVGSEWWPGLRR